MTNEQRLAKLNQARDLIREVEFSYESVSNDYRKRLYQGIVATFSFGGPFASVMGWIAEDIKRENKEQE